MKIYDVTALARPGMPVWPGQPQFDRDLVESIDRGDACNVSRLTFSAHTGTHVDAPCHFLAGRKSMEQLDVNKLVGPCVVVEVPGDGDIGPAEFEAARASGQLPAGTKRVLLKTSNTRRGLLADPKFREDYAAVTAEGAKWLVENGVETIGVDYLSVETFRPEVYGCHLTLLGAETFIIEGLLLSDVPAGEYLLVCGALKLQGSDGAPARVFLLTGVGQD